MTYTRTAYSDSTVVYGNDTGKKACLKYYGNKARIGYFDLDEGLLKAIEKEASERGCSSIIHEYYSGLSERQKFFEKRGYEYRESINILSVKLKEIIRSKAVEKALHIPFKGMSWEPLRNLSEHQLLELEDVFMKRSIPVGIKELSRFDEDLSGVTYDQNHKIQAFILVSTQVTDIIVEFIYGLNRKDTMYVMSALQAFAKEILNLGIYDIYENISFLEINDATRPLITRLLDKKYQVWTLGAVATVRKDLEKENYEDITFEDNIQEGLFKPKVLYPYQANINWKMQWKYDEA